jgi:hypothetical protein
MNGGIGVDEGDGVWFFSCEIRVAAEGWQRERERCLSIHGPERRGEGLPWRGGAAGGSRDGK